jgi:hypothetical protein
MHIRYVINQHHCDKLKIILKLIIKYKNIPTFNTLKHIYGFFFFFFCDKDQKLSTLPCFHL